MNTRTEEINHEETKGTKKKKNDHSLALLLALLRVLRLFVVFLAFTIAPTVSGQSPTPAPAPNESVANADAMTNLFIVAGNLIPRLRPSVARRPAGLSTQS